MRILFTIGTLCGGGAERNVSLLANALVNEGNQVGILTTWGDEKAYELDSRVEYMTLVAGNRNKYIKFVKQVYMIRAAVKKYAPELIISFLSDVNSCVLLRTRFLKCRVIISERNDPHIDPTINVFRILRKIMYPFADGYVFQTPDARAYFAKVVEHKPNIVIPNPVRSDLPIHEDNESRIIVTASRLVPQKNLSMLIEAFEIVLERHSDCELHIFGQGPLEAELQQLICKKKLQDQVKLLGFDKNVCQKMNQAEIFVLSSNYEGMSNSMLEALGMGMPVVVTDCPIGGARMLIKDGENGLLVPVNNKESMAKAIIYLLENPEKRKKMGISAAKVREDNSIASIIQKWQKFIETCMER